MFKRLPIILVAISLVGCSSIPSARKLVWQAKKAHKAEDHAAVLRNMEQVVDTQPQALDKTRFQDEVALYRDSQIIYGLEQARAAESAGRLPEAWVWYTQVSLVDEEREECATAKQESDRLLRAICEQSRADAEQALASGDSRSAAASAARGMWFGDGGCGDILQKVCSQKGEAPAASTQVIRTADVAGIVRTDSIERLVKGPLFAPYGLPVYFGDVPRYYVSLGELRVEGMPMTQDMPPAYAKIDPLAKMTKKARKKGADALINVHYWTRRKKAITRGEMVQFLDLPTEAPEEPPAPAEDESTNRTQSASQGD